MSTSRFLSAAALAASVLALGGCVMAPVGALPPNTSYVAPPSPAYVPEPGYGHPGGYQAYGQVVNVQIYQGGSAPMTSGAGAVAGGVAGGALGYNIAGRHDRAGASVVGAIVGALIGNAIEANSYGGYAGRPIYRVTVRTNDNALRTFDYGQNPGVRVGEYVQVNGNQLYRLQY